jgi:hypothetical protein
MRSPLRALGLALAAFVSFAGAARASPIDAPPAGLHAVQTTLSDVLRRYDSAVGSTHFHTRVEQWRVQERGLTGTYVQKISGDEYVATLSLGPFVTMEGRSAGQSWRQDENGLTVLRQDIHKKTAISEKSIDQAFETPDSPGPGIELLGQTSGDAPAYVVQVHPAGGRLVWLFFDATTGLIAREESVVAERRVVTTYDDFRRTAGITEAWHHHTSDGRPNNEEDWTMVSLQMEMPIAAADFGIPDDRRALIEFPSGVSEVRLPARILAGKVIVRLTVAGRGLDFLLDSGAGDIAFDADVAGSLGLTSVGKQTQEVAGRFDRSRAIVPEIRVGDLRMHDVVVSILPFQSSPDAGTRVVGLLGFDFFKNAVVRIDYEHGTVDAIEPSRFVPPSQAVALPVALDDGVPLVPATVGEDRGNHFILDTGSAFTIIFSGFAADHPLAVADQGGGALEQRTHGVVTARGIGGEVRLFPTELRLFRFGGSDFADYTAYVTHAARALEREDEDGLIGAPTLSRFIVYLDYPRRQVELVRNP